MKDREVQSAVGAHPRPAAERAGTVVATGARQLRQALHIATLQGAGAVAEAEQGFSARPQAGDVAQLSTATTAMPGLQGSGDRDEDEEDDKRKTLRTDNEEEEEADATTTEDETEANAASAMRSGVRDRAARRFRVRARHAGAKDTSGHGEGKKISSGLAAERHQVGQNRKVRRRKDLSKRVKEAAEELAEFGLTANQVMGQRGRERLEAKALEKQKRKEKKDDGH